MPLEVFQTLNHLVTQGSHSCLESRLQALFKPVPSRTGKEETEVKVM